jgi:hypothetical protein
MRASQPLGTGNGQLTTPYGQQLRDPYKRQPENEAARRYLPENGKWILSRLPGYSTPNSDDELSEKQLLSRQSLTHPQPKRQPPPRAISSKIRRQNPFAKSVSLNCGSQNPSA